MKCERCGEREGEVQYTEYVDGEMRRSQVCRPCAEELGFGDEADRPAPGPTSAGQILGVVKIEAMLQGEEVLPPDTRHCTRCGSTAEELDDHSLFGCPACYEAFETSLETLFRRVHGRVRHRGRIPGGSVDAPPEEEEDSGLGAPGDEPGDESGSGGDSTGGDPEGSA